MVVPYSAGFYIGILVPDFAARCPPAAATLPTGLGQQHPLLEALRGNPVVFVQRVPPESTVRLLLQGLSHRHVRMSGDAVSLRGK